MWRTKRAETITIRITRSRPLYPQSIITLHVNSTAYADFDFRNPDFHELQVWEVPASVRIEAAPDFIGLLEKGKCILRPPAGGFRNGFTTV